MVVKLHRGTLNRHTWTLYFSIIPRALLCRQATSGRDRRSTVCWRIEVLPGTPSRTLFEIRHECSAGRQGGTERGHQEGSVKASFGVGVGRELWLRGFVSSSAQPGSGLSPIMVLHAVVGTVLPTNKRPVFFSTPHFPLFLNLHHFNTLLFKWS